MNKLKIGFVGIAVVAAAIIAAVTGAVYACPQTTTVDCTNHNGNDHDQKIDLQLKDQDQTWGEGVSQTWTALNMAPGQTFAFTGSFVGLRINAPSLAQVTCDYQVTKGLPDQMAQQMILTRCVYGGTFWTIDCLTGKWQIMNNGHILFQGTNLQWKLADTDKDGQITFYDLKKSPLNYLPLPDSSITDSTQFQISVKFASATGNDLENDTLNMNMDFTATAWDNSCNNYGVDPKIMLLFFGGQTVTKASASTSITSSSNPSNYGQSVTFTATVKAASNSGGTPTGSVTFYDGDTALSSNVPLVSGSASIKTSALTVGSHNITAVYSGDTNFTGGTSNVLVQKVRGKTVCSWPSRPGPCNFGQTCTFKVQIGWQGSVAPTGNVTFYDGPNSIGTGNWSGDTAVLNCLLSSGSHNITAKYSGDDNYDGSTSDVVNQTVNKVSSATTLKSLVNPAKSGSNVTFTATVVATTPGAGSLSGSVTFKDGTTTLGTITLSSGKATFSTSKLSVGTHSITAIYSGDGNFNSSVSSTVNQVINR